MSYKPSYAPGDWKAVCYLCGSTYKASQLRKHWQGYWVCPEDWEMRQPQDFVRGVADKQVPPWIQPEPEDTFLDVCTPFSSSAIPGYANPGCMIPSKLSPSYTTPTGYVSSGYILEGYV